MADGGDAARPRGARAGHEARDPQHGEL